VAVGMLFCCRGGRREKFSNESESHVGRDERYEGLQILSFWNWSWSMSIQKVVCLIRDFSQL
jgi:hypothetical protein